MKTVFNRIALVILFLFGTMAPEIKAGHPCCYVLICCRDNNKGMTFLVNGKVRFACPNGGVPPQDWHRISEAEWKRRAEWASQAEQYSIYGSYDDTCDGIHWGIADTKGTDVKRNKYPGDQPYYYYDILKNILTGKVALPGK